jgi:hypothetical protein
MELSLACFMLNPSCFSPMFSCKILAIIESSSIVNSLQLQVSQKTGSLEGILPLITFQVKALCLKHKDWLHFIQIPGS